MAGASAAVAAPRGRKKSLAAKGREGFFLCFLEVERMPGGEGKRALVRKGQPSVRPSPFVT
jgi:hypothetical protein